VCRGGSATAPTDSSETHAEAGAVLVSSLARARASLPAKRGAGFAGRGEALADFGLGVLGVLLVLEGQAVVILDLGQRFEEIDGAEIALAENGEVLRVLHVLEMDAEGPLPEDLDGTNG